MSTPNFWTSDIFPLFAIDDEYFYPEGEYAPERQEWVWEFSDNYDFWSNNDVKPALDELNEGLTFHEVQLKPGYYIGAQLWVENPEGFDEQWNNRETRYYFDLCRSEAIRKYHAEQRKICRWMEKHAPALGFEKLHCVGIFSNGEAVYKLAS